jgi:hypothetical protein
MWTGFWHDSPVVELAVENCTQSTGHVIFTLIAHEREIAASFQESGKIGFATHVTNFLKVQFCLITIYAFHHNENNIFGQCNKYYNFLAIQLRYTNWN